MTTAYNPLDYDNLANSVVTALLRSDLAPLPPGEAFFGSGVYALYYTGALTFYSHISASDALQPIYVGKAVPSGARKGSQLSKPASGRALHNRLREHSRSVNQAENLDLAEFQVRYLVVEPVWITLAERFLIDRFQPLWNTVIDGFGDHTPGKGRSNMRRPRWDIVHPGRSWAAGLSAEETAGEVIRRISAAG